MQLLDVIQLPELVVLAVVSLGQHVAAKQHQRRRIRLLERYRHGLRIFDGDAGNAVGFPFLISFAANDM
ncbi:hypothetical protein D3C76_1733020 [compost metagenome]